MPAAPDPRSSELSLPTAWRIRSAKRQPRRDIKPSVIRESHLEPCYRAFGRWMRKRRLRANITQAELAKRLGVSREWVAGVEGGFQRVLFHQVLAVADLFERELRP
ncbi:MAG: helix-turn-helix domain-containing protein [Pseudomonadota bacterium]|nr:helix-turn-helix domain-containing protein [Pseudomonadota bacterium]